MAQMIIAKIVSRNLHKVLMSTLCIGSEEFILIGSGIAELVEN